MRKRRAIFLPMIAALSLTGGLTACGQSNSDKIAAQIDANASESDVVDGVTATDQSAQKLADEDARDAEQARKRRKELADLERTQQAETERILRDGVPGGNDEDYTIPIGSGDPAVDKFRARLAGVCEGGQTRILEVGKDAEKAAKTKDPIKVLAAAQSYSRALDDFLNALQDLDAPGSVKRDYRAWLVTINDLAANVRLQLVTQGDPQKSRKLQEKGTELTAQLVQQSAALGVTCLSAT